MGIRSVLTNLTDYVSRSAGVKDTNALKLLKNSLNVIELGKKGVPANVTPLDIPDFTMFKTLTGHNPFQDIISKHNKVLASKETPSVADLKVTNNHITDARKEIEDYLEGLTTRRMVASAVPLGAATGGLGLYTGLQSKKERR